MKVYYWTAYNHKDTDTQYKRKRKQLEQVFDYCAANNIEYHPINDPSELIIHVAVCNRFKEDYLIVAEDFGKLPTIKDNFPFESVKDFLIRG